MCTSASATPPIERVARAPNSLHVFVCRAGTLFVDSRLVGPVDRGSSECIACAGAGLVASSRPRAADRWPRARPNHSFKPTAGYGQVVNHASAAGGGLTQALGARFPPRSLRSPRRLRTSLASAGSAIKRRSSRPHQSTSRFSGWPVDRRAGRVLRARASGISGAVGPSGFAAPRGRPGYGSVVGSGGCFTGSGGIACA